MAENKAWGEPTGKFFGEDDTLLNQLNKYAHAAGTDAALRDLLQRAWKRIDKLEATYIRLETD